MVPAMRQPTPVELREWLEGFVDGVKGRGMQLSGHCPLCEGKDDFSFNLEKGARNVSPGNPGESRPLRRRAGRTCPRPGGTAAGENPRCPLQSGNPWQWRRPPKKPRHGDRLR